MRLMADAGIRLTFDRRGYRPDHLARRLRDQDPQAAEHCRDAASRLARPGLRRRRLGDGEGGRAGRAGRHRPRPGPHRGRRRHRISSTATGRPSPASWSPPSMSGSPGAWLDRRGFDGRIVRSYGATEVFPPEDADCIVDNTATGTTLKANGLMIFDELMRSSTRLYACPRSLDQPGQARADRAFRRPGPLGPGRPQAGDAGGQRAGRPARGRGGDPALHARADDRAAAPRCRLRGEGGRAARRPARA